MKDFIMYAAMFIGIVSGAAWAGFEIGHFTAPHVVQEVIGTRIPDNVASQESVDREILEQQQTRAMYAAIMGIPQGDKSTVYPKATCAWGCGNKTDGASKDGIQSNVQIWRVACDTAGSGQQPKWDAVLL